MKNSDKWIYILGVNGWYVGSHDAAACLIRASKQSCEILYALEEEKLTAIKGAYDRFPVFSIKEILTKYQLEPADINYICIGWDYPSLYRHKKLTYDYRKNDILTQLFSGCNYSDNTELHFVDHHLAHASSVSRTSGFKNSCVFVFDGEGERESGSIWKYSDSSIHKLATISIPASLGYLYEATNVFLRFKHHESGKTMGLAPYGAPIYADELARCFELDSVAYNVTGGMQKLFEKLTKRELSARLDSQKNAILMWSCYFEERLKISPSGKMFRSFYDIPDIYKNLAASVQETVERIVTGVMKNTIENTGYENVCLVGGVALNCSMNGVLNQKDFIKNIYVHPASGDSGVALGAALEMAYRLELKSSIDDKEFNPYLGKSYSNEEIVNAVKAKNLAYKEYSDASNYIANAIAMDKKVALFQGKNEWGPRALGNRSIIARADIRDNLDFINVNIKSRELGRPLGPSLLEEDSDVLSKDVSRFNRHMTAAYKVDKNSSAYPAITHVNSTYRPQFVSKRNNPTFYEQLKSVKEKMGTSIVINTSLNLDTPIIYTPQAAIDFFVERDIDAVVYNNSLVIEK